MELKKIYNSVNSSNQRQLSRIATFCKNNINCIFNITYPCNNNHITYYNPSGVFMLNPLGVSTWQGMCDYINGQIVLCGTTMPSNTSGSGLVYIGNIKCDDPLGQYINFYVPNSEYTSCYGPRYNKITDTFTLVGSYNNPNDTNIYGFLFIGTINDLTNNANYTYKMQPEYNEYPITFVHSTYGNFAVGASGTLITPVQDIAWIYDINKQIYTEFKFNNAKYNTIYGIVQNSEYNYTIVGGFSNLNKDISTGFIGDFEYNPNDYSITYSNLTSFQITNTTHFEGISLTNNKDIYTLAGDIDIGGIGLIIRRNNITKQFEIIKIQKIDYSCSVGQSGLTTSNSVLGNNFVGYFISNNSNISSSWQCSITF